MIGVIIGCVLGSVAFLILVRLYMNGGRNKNFPQLLNKTIIVTGSNTGIGYYTVLEMAKLNPKTIVLACRNQQRTLEAIQNLKNNLPQTCQTSLEFIELDLNDLTSVQQFARTFQSQYKALDILINNAGIMALPKRETTVQKFEKQLGTNHIGHFLLTKLLENLLTDKSRIINVSSLVHERGKIFFDDIQCEHNYTPFGAYGQSKLANIYFTKQLQNKFIEQGKQIKVVSLHPGIVRTELTRYIFENIFKKITCLIFLPIQLLLLKNAWQGAQTTLHCALCDYKNLDAGSYYSDCKVKKEKLPKNWQEEIQKFWILSENWVKNYIF